MEIHPKDAQLFIEKLQQGDFDNPMGGEDPMALEYY